MCGIVGYIGNQGAEKILLNGLKRLEYRGYDSSGLAILANGKIQLRRSVGKLSNLENALNKDPLTGNVGLGHTRWATHGAPSAENAHPHTDCKDEIVVVHNGIIENYLALKSELQKKGHVFASETDTEIIAHLIEGQWKLVKSRHKKEKDFIEAVRKTLLRLEGAYALGVATTHFPELLIAARKDCPLSVGIGEGENFIASDVPAIISHTRKTISMGQKEIALIRKEGVECISLEGKSIKKAVTQVSWDPVQAEKSGYQHFMLKEIMEQPTAIQDTLRGRIFRTGGGLQLNLAFDGAFAKSLSKITLVACGTSYHSALVARFWFESIAKLPCQVEIASEYRYRQNFLNRKDLAIYISQSGETADTLAALRQAKASGALTLAICNVLGSTITAEADHTFYTHCGPEIGVASTKAFTGQLTALLLLAVQFGHMRGELSQEALKKMIQQLLKLPGWTRKCLDLTGEIENVAKLYNRKSHFLYLGRHLNYPIALEGALKLKEISYIHAEGYPAGEMKHGPIALIDETMPIVVLVTRSEVYAKIRSNIEEAKARGGRLIAIATQGDRTIASQADQTIYVPNVPEFLTPIINSIPLQLIAYHIAVQRGCDVDQPRNLAKSVTVE